MQARAVAAALTLLLVGAAATRAGSARSGEAAAATAAARAWLREHPAAQTDELAELRSENPQAYALVKALLAKRSLGLLDPRHPSASFSTRSRPAGGADALAAGPAAFQGLAGPSHAATAAVYPEVAAAPAHRDWLNWRPQQSAADDDAMVSNVLGAVAQLKAGGQDHAEDREAAGQATVPGAADQSASQQEAPAKAVAPAVRENAYLKGIDLGVAATAPQPPPASHENSYLKGIDLGTASPDAPRKAAKLLREDSTDYLASFSWGDDEPRARATSAGGAVARPAAGVSQVEAAAAPAGEAQRPEPTEQQPRHDNALLAWLSGNSAAHASAAPAAPAAPVQPSAAPGNAYLSDLQ